MDKEIENQLLALWLLELRMNTTHILKEYLEDEELLAWARKNIKQKVFESNPKMFEVYYQETQLLFIARELDYHRFLRDKKLIERN